MKRVILESPYRAQSLRERWEFDRYVRQAVRYCALEYGEAAIASHLMWTQALDDNDPAERELGLECGHAWLAGAERVVVFTDHGVSDGMQRGINRALKAGVVVETRDLPGRC